MESWEVVNIIAAHDMGGKQVLCIRKKPNGKHAAALLDDICWDDLSSSDCTEIMVAFRVAAGLITKLNNEVEDVEVITN